MTVEEAIKELKRHISPYKNCKADADANEAIDTAIKSLEWQEEFMNKVYEQNQEAEFYINGRRFRVREVPQ